MKTTDLVVQNIRGLLNAQGKHQGTLAFALGKDRSWVNKILNGRRGLDVSELNGIADFFHIEAYQLLQPGIAQRTERRSGTDRRNGRDRREAEAIKSMQELRERLKMAGHGVNTSSGASPLGGDDRTDIQARFVARLKREISAAQDRLRELARASEQIRQQVDEVSTARHPVTPALRRSRRNHRSSDSAADKE